MKKTGDEKSRDTVPLSHFTQTCVLLGEHARLFAYRICNYHTLVCHSFQFFSSNKSIIKIFDHILAFETFLFLHVCLCCPLN
jgi:hypothetical protein